MIFFFHKLQTFEFIIVCYQRVYAVQNILKLLARSYKIEHVLGAALDKNVARILSKGFTKMREPIMRSKIFVENLVFGVYKKNALRLREVHMTN